MRPVSIRYKGSLGGGVALTHVPADQVESTVKDLVRSGSDVGLITINESMPDDRLLIQGEAIRTATGLELAYSRSAGLSMRQAMMASMRVSGLRAKLIIEAFLCPNSQDDLALIMEQYPDAAVEFGAYSTNVGLCPKRNTIFWEVRDY